VPDLSARIGTVGRSRMDESLLMLAGSRAHSASGAMSAQAPVGLCSLKKSNASEASWSSISG
jgi:hypothetical protein